MPQNLASLQNLHALERETGVGGQIDMLLQGNDLTKPAVVEWMSAYESAVLKRFGYSRTRRLGERPAGVRQRGASARPSRCPTSSKARGEAARSLTPAEIDALLGAIPPYFSPDVISADRRSATLAFGIRLMPLDRQQRVIETMRSMLHPPPGVQRAARGPRGGRGAGRRARGLRGRPRARAARQPR